MIMDMTLIIFASAALATGLVAGVFLGFSDFIMRSLAATNPVAGIQAMQIINREVYSSVFLVLLLGMGPVSLGVIGYAVFWMTGPAQVWAIAGGTIYVLGTVLVTMVGNVPMNQRLDVMAGDQAATQAYWRHYARVWTRWNHLRTVMSALASVCFVLVCVALA